MIWVKLSFWSEGNLHESISTSTQQSKHVLQKPGVLSLAWGSRRASALNTYVATNGSNLHEHTPMTRAGWGARVLMFLGTHDHEYVSRPVKVRLFEWMRPVSYSYTSIACFDKRKMFMVYSWVQIRVTQVLKSLAPSSSTKGLPTKLVEDLPTMSVGHFFTTLGLVV